VARFAQATAITVTSNIIRLLLGIITSVLIARILGPEGKGVYTLATLLPSLILIFANLGIGSATVYHVAQGRYPRPQILGNNILFAVGVFILGITIGLIITVYFHSTIFPGIARGYLLLALALIPGSLLFAYLQPIFLGTHRITQYNASAILQDALLLILLAVTLGLVNGGVAGALIATALTWLIVDVPLLLRVRRVAGGISFRPNLSYIKQALAYGIQAHLGNILGFLSYRVDVFLVNGFLSPAAVGLYSIAVGLVERLWLISQAASIVLFPRVAAESDEKRRKELTPLVARTVLLATGAGSLLLFVLSPWILELLYSSSFLPAVQPLQILLPGIVALSVSRVLANDIAGRGRVMLNNYAVGITVAVNIALNLLWIPEYGIVGAAWASTASYGLTLLITVGMYCRLAGNPWTKVVLPQGGDWVLYRRTVMALWQWTEAKIRILERKIWHNKPG